ncbi:N-acetylmuramoyl-L-alanine amidase family protein [Bacillus sp. BGMRC 2118]|nr:N-acetylmuramoyl-L-alanine amidase family protein [Bacillus sp. BGMRC 2118]
MRKIAVSLVLTTFFTLFLSIYSEVTLTEVEASTSTYTGWKSFSRDWYYYKNGVKQKGWIYDNGKWYFLDDQRMSMNAMKTGWFAVGGKWYYADSSGAMQTGWIKSIGAWFYLKSSGEMATGWIKENKTWYYLNGSGAMQTGWIMDKGDWYYLNKSGAMLTGWILYGGSRYYLEPDGKMATKTYIDGNKIGVDGRVEIIETDPMLISDYIMVAAEESGYEVQFADHSGLWHFYNNGDHVASVDDGFVYVNMEKDEYLRFATNLAEEIGALNRDTDIYTQLFQMQFDSSFSYRDDEVGMYYNEQTNYAEIYWGPYWF